MRILLHICCAPCLCGALPAFADAQVMGYFYNPNIHPLLEFRRRLKALHVYQEKNRGIEIHYEEDYGLQPFLERVVPNAKDRCRRCYQMRLTRAAAAAAELGCEAVSSTLLISPHQNHERIREVGEEAAAQAGVKFEYRDLRPHFESGRQAAKKAMLYSQQYCGCIYSEADRYQPTTKHLYKGPGGQNP